jgi:hypothetical protein
MLANIKTVTTFDSSDFSIDFTLSGKGLMSGIIYTQVAEMKPHQFTGLYNRTSSQFDLSFIVEWDTLVSNLKAMTAFSGFIKRDEVNKSIMLLNWLLSWENLLNDEENFIRDGTTILMPRIIGATENSFHASENCPFPIGLSHHDLKF